MEQIFTSIPTEELFLRLEQIVKDVVKSELQNQPVEKCDEELITRKEAAKLLGISLPTLSSYTKDGLLPAYKISPRLMRYKKSEVMAALTGMNKYERHKNRL